MNIRDELVTTAARQLYLALQNGNTGAMAAEIRKDLTGLVFRFWPNIDQGTVDTIFESVGYGAGVATAGVKTNAEVPSHRQ